MLQLSPAGRRYGYLKDKFDHRDFGARFMPPSREPSTLVQYIQAPRADLESWCGPVRDQGDEGSCTWHAGVGNREFLAIKYQNQYPILSPAFGYYLGRAMDSYMADNNGQWATNDQLLAYMATHPQTEDSGSFGRTTCRILNQFGCCRLAEENYIPGQFATPPTPDQLTEALAWKGGAYHRLATVHDMRACIASGYTFMIGFTVYESFESIGSTGIWTPDKNENVLGGHEVLAIGFDDTVNGGSFKVRNSWGSGWAAGGNFWMRYADAGDPDVLEDAWMTHLGKAWVN